MNAADTKAAREYENGEHVFLFLLSPSRVMLTSTPKKLLIVGLGKKKKQGRDIVSSYPHAHLRRGVAGTQLHSLGI